jgi:hypothetical protein
MPNNEVKKESGKNLCRMSNWVRGDLRSRRDLHDSEDCKNHHGT